MENKILISVYVPVINQEYNIFVPVSKNTYNITALISEAISDLSNGNYNYNANTVLCDKLTGKILDRKKNIKDNGIKNGSRLLLI